MISVIILRKIAFFALFICLNVSACACFTQTPQQGPRNSKFAKPCSPKTAPITYDTTSIVWSSKSIQDEPESTAQFPPVPHLVVLLPAYNEVQRIGGTIETYQSYLESSDQWKQKTHILVVDDGSKDGTAGFVQSWKSDGKVNVDCVSLSQNQGKGVALSFGIRHLATQFAEEPCLVLIADADGSGDISCLDKMVQSLGHLIASQTALPTKESFWRTQALLVGNRGYEGSSVSRSILRWGFRTTVRILCGDLRVNDSQCGFKLLTLTAANRLYANLNLKRWSHDVEVLYRAREYNIPISEEPVRWQDKEGSKLITGSPLGAVRASSTMLLEVLRMRIEYTMGRWKLPSEKDRMDQ
jgi:dolichyl-phosphate beta-glucosyltransferase